MNDTRPFPIQGGFIRVQNDFSLQESKSEIPWWLAEIAYEHYAKLYGKQQSLERLAERGGFGRDELVSLLRRESHEQAILNSRQRS